MAISDCLIRGIDGGEIDPDLARPALELFEKLEAEYRGSMSPGEASRRASVDTVEAVRRDISERRRQAGLQIERTQALSKHLQDFRNARGEEDFASATIAVIGRDQLSSFSSVEARAEAIRGRLHARMDEVLSTFRRDLLGRVRERALLENMVREAFGEATGDAAAKEMAAAWREGAEFARVKFNASGGRIPSRTDWGMPQMHDPLAVRKVSYETWRDFVVGRLDPEKMIDEITGLPMRGERLELALRDVYETIKTDGFVKLRPGPGAGRKLANRNTDHRFLVFKNADTWMEYQNRFGKTDPYSIMMGHLDRMARDIALLEVMGPNPAATMRWLEQVSEKQAALKDAAEGTSRGLEKAKARLNTARSMYEYTRGATNAPVDGLVARTFAGTRSFLQSMQLGAASISAITDINFMRLAAKHAGIPQAKVLGRYAKMLSPVVTEDQKLAVRLGLIAENWSSVAAAMARYTGEVSGPEISRRVADSVMRLSGLSPMTQAGRWAFGMEFMGFLADNAGTPWAQLPKNLQRTMKAYGFGGDTWDIMRRSPLYEHEGATFLRPEDIISRMDLSPKHAEDLGTRLLEMIQTETEYAVPSSSLRGRAMLLDDAKPGTFKGELLRSFAMYKNFGVTLLFTHVRRMALKSGADRLSYATDLLISTTIMGALALQLKEIAKGRDPRDMTAPGFWGAAMLQGGGLGIFGDFMLSDVNRFGGGLAGTFAGPVVGFADDVRRLTLGNALQFAANEKTNFGAELTNFFRRYTPGGSLWYLRLAYERAVLDQLQKQIDPRAGRRMRSLERKRRREHGQGYWWSPGKIAPKRAPELETAIGG